MKKLQLLLYLLIANFSNAQIATFTDYRVKYADVLNKRIDFTGEGECDSNSLIIYPIIKTSEPKIDEKINNTFFKSVSYYYGSGFKKLPVHLMIDSFVYYGMTTLNYVISHNNNGILSFNVESYHCGANCWLNQYFYNFDLSTGKLFLLSDIISQKNASLLYKKLLKDKQHQIDSFINSVKQEFDNSEFKDITDWINTCKDSVYMDRFKIDSSGIVVFNKCYFGTIFRGYEPEIWIAVKFKETPEFFSKQFLEKMKLQY
jgi:hypothetical protein